MSKHGQCMFYVLNKIEFIDLLLTLVHCNNLGEL